MSHMTTATPRHIKAIPTTFDMTLVYGRDSNCGRKFACGCRTRAAMKNPFQQELPPADTPPGMTLCEQFAELRELSRDHSQQAMGLLPVQLALSAALIASGTSGRVDRAWFDVSTGLLGLSFCITAMTLARVLRQPSWTAKEATKLRDRDANKVAEKGLMVMAAAYVSLCAVLAVAVTGSKALN